MSTRDMYDKSILKALQSIAKSLDRLANVAEGKSSSELTSKENGVGLLKRYKDGDY